MLVRIPDHVSFNEACVLGLGLAVAVYSLFNEDAVALTVPKPGGNKPNGKLLLAWDGSSSVGVCGIQVAKAAGYTVAATASAKNFGLMREIGVKYVFDYNRESVVENIVAALQGKGEMMGIFCAILRPLFWHNVRPSLHRTARGKEARGDGAAAGVPATRSLAGGGRDQR
jgi:NADPH:quinone reductase-like Zn-dependent oxidoreductase